MDAESCDEITCAAWHEQVAGALLGAVEFLIVIWIIFLALTIVCNTKAGEAALQIIKKDCILSFIYDRDILIRIFMSIFY